MERDTNEEYKFYCDSEDPACPTLLHHAVEWNFLHVAKLLIAKYPSLLYTKTEEVPEKNGYLPVEKALMLYNDETAAYLISQMRPDRWVTVLLNIGLLYLSSGSCQLLRHLLANKNKQKCNYSSAYS